MSGDYGQVITVLQQHKHHVRPECHWIDGTADAVVDAALLEIELTAHTDRYQGCGVFAMNADLLGKTVRAR